MVKHKIGRKVATIAVIIGWVFVVTPLVTIVYIGVSAFGPSGISLAAVARLLEIIPWGATGFIVVLFGYVARAVFDIAERVSLGPSSS